MTMTDREMLEYAIIAYGIPYIKPTVDYDGSLGLEVGSNNPMRCYSWNPLNDDGDALRLAIQLNILVNPDGNSVEVINDDGYSVAYNYADFGSKAEAVRRAIVQAAAEIGKKMT